MAGAAPKKAAGYHRALREHNAEMVELWMLTYGHEVTTRPPEERNPGASNANRPSSRPNQDLVWLEALSDPEAQATHAILSRLILSEMPRQRPGYWRALRGVYMTEHSDPTLPAFWERRARDLEHAAGERDRGGREDEAARIRSSAGEDRVRAELVRRALAWVVSRVGNRTLYVPAPEHAREEARETARRKRVAFGVYGSVLERTGGAMKARKAAAQASGYSVATISRMMRSRDAGRAGKA